LSIFICKFHVIVFHFALAMSKLLWWWTCRH